ncbi:MAG: hypothetical protein GKS01_13305 [Alphaproteobacteria bacterium]|nr:hypothetical protein [Alphaproteobacteria bacterium]
MRTGKFLKGPVGQGAQNNPEDVFVVRHLIRVAGGKEIDETKDDPDADGFFDSDLDEEIHDFQEKNGLRVDGVLNPGGETERNIVSHIVDDERPIGSTDDFSLNHSVGEGGENTPEDVSNIRRLLAASGRLPFDVSAPPPQFIDSDVVDTLREIQQEKGFQAEGLVSEGDETFVALRGEAKELATRKENEHKIQVAALPAALIPLLIQAGRATPAILRSLGLIGAATNIPKVPNKSSDEPAPNSNERTEAATPLPNTLPGRTPVPPVPDHEEFPVDPIEHSIEGFPPMIPVDPWVETFPDSSDEIPKTFIVERHENEETVVHNSDLMKAIEECSAKEANALKHKGGARKGDEKIKEYYLRNKLAEGTDGRKGSSFLDLSFKDPVTKRFLHLNTVDTKAKGTQPSKREDDAAKRIIQNMNTETGDILVLVPKLAKNETFDLEKFKAFIMPIIREVNKNYKEGESDPVDRPRRLDPLKEPLSE